jgi:hypothetical protein
MLKRTNEWKHVKFWAVGENVWTVKFPWKLLEAEVSILRANLIKAILWGCLSSNDNCTNVVETWLLGTAGSGTWKSIFLPVTNVFTVVFYVLTLMEESGEKAHKWERMAMRYSRWIKQNSSWGQKTRPMHHCYTYVLVIIFILPN